MNSNIKPNLFIVGAPKCGTTSLYHYLRQHPEIFMSNFKEPHYFGKDLTRLNNLYYTEEKKYLKLFTMVKKEKIIGEASLHYLYSYSAPGEIKNFNSKSKIIILLRHPTEMIYSLHSQLLFSGNEVEQDFIMALELEDIRLKGKNIPSKIDLIEKLFYRTYVEKLPDQIQRYQKIFSKENVKIMLLSDLQNNVNNTYQNILKFLNVDPSFTPEFTIENPHKSFRFKIIRDIVKYSSPILGNMRGKFTSKSLGIMKFIQGMNNQFSEKKTLETNIKEKLDQEFKPTIIKLEEIINRDLSHWYH